MIDLTRLAPMPPSLVELVEGRTAAPSAPPAPMRQRLARLSSISSVGGGDYGSTALQRELDDLVNARPGTRNHALNRAAFSAYQLVEAGVVAQEVADMALRATAESIGLGEFEVRQTLRSAREGAARSPRSANRLPRTLQEPSRQRDDSRNVQAQVEGSEEEPPRLYPALTSKLLTTDEMLQRPPPAPLLGDILFENTLAALYGHPGSMKSFLALDWVLSLCKGYQWFDKPLKHGASALYVAAEGVAGIGPRVRAWFGGHGLFDTNMPNLEWYPEALQLLNVEWIDALAYHTAQTRPSLIVIDTLSRSMAGGDENDSVSMTTAVSHLDHVRQASGATILVVHHSPKVGGGLRGHSSLHGACDTEIEVSRDDKALLVKCAKQKDAEAFSDIHLWWTPVEGYPSIVLTDRPQDADDGKIRRDAETVWSKLWSHYQHTGATKALIVEATGLTEREVIEAINLLFDDRRATKEGTGFKARWKD